jgi:hypothetical protein
VGFAVREWRTRGVWVEDSRGGEQGSGGYSDW